MTKPFPKKSFYQDNYAPLRMESSAPDLIIHGAIPKDLNGTLYRNGPNPRYPSLGNDHHWFDGDGMVHAFRLRDGKASYLNRWVQTDRWKLEDDAGTALFATFGNPLHSDKMSHDKNSGVANTNIVPHAGRLLALEEAHRPFEIDATTLEPRGYCDFDGKMSPNTFTAHPKIDAQTGEMLAFGYMARGIFGPQVAFYHLNAKGELLRTEEFEAPFSSMMHDFMVSKDHIIFPVFPLTGSMDRAIAGQPPFAFEKDKGTHIAIMPRQGGAQDIKWLTAEGCYVFHPMNAWSDGETLTTHVIQYEEAPLFPRADGSPGDKSRQVGRLYEWKLDFTGNEGSLRQTCLDDQPGEFPRFDERFMGKKTRHGYALRAEQNPDATGFNFNTVVHYDFLKGQDKTHSFAKHDTCSEPVFVPRHASAEEGDGYLLTVVHRGAENRSDLVILDATDIKAAPIAVAELPHRVPHGFHGNWLGQA